MDHLMRAFLFPAVVSCSSFDMPHVSKHSSQPFFTNTLSLRCKKKTDCCTVHFLLYDVCRSHRQAVLDAEISRKALPPQMLKLNDNAGRGRHVGHSLQ